MIRVALPKAFRAQLWERRTGLTWLAILIIGFAGIPKSSQAGTTNYPVRGVLKEIKQDEHQLVIAHDDIPNFMEAMTMPFNVKDDAILTNVAGGEKITFQLHVTKTESWIDHIEP